MIFLILNLVLISVATVSGYFEQDVDELTKNLFENLRADPTLLGDSEFSDESKAFVDKHVSNYLALVMGSGGTEYSRSKRSLREIETLSENYFVDLKPFKNITTTSSVDMVLFRQNSMWYVASLENEFNGETSQTLKIKRIESDSFGEVARMEVSNGVGVSAFTFDSFTIITVAENSSAHQHLTNIVKFNAEEEVEVIQTIPTSYVSHVEIWEQEEDVYMAVAQFMKEEAPGIRLEADTPIYKWQGRHFDLIQFIGTSGVLKISHFSVEDVHFLAVANSGSDSHNQHIYSEIFKYDVENERFRLFQKIRTHGCRDIKAFKIYLDGEEEDFLVVANAREKGGNGADRDVPSIIYKFVDNYFIPFQSLQIRGVTELQPVTVAGGGEVVLFAGTTSHGIKCFHYNGWHFVESQIESEDEVTSGRIEAMHSYGYREESVLVIVNEHENETTANVFEVGFSSRNELKGVYKEMFAWCLDKKKSIERMQETEILGVFTRGDIPVASQNLSHNPEDDAENVEKSIQVHMTELDGIEDKLSKLSELRNVDEKIINGDIRANHMILNKDAFINSIQTESINDLGADIFEKPLNIDDGFEIDSMEFHFLSVKDNIFPRTINDFPADSILHKPDLLNVDNLIIDGVVEFLSDVDVHENINNIPLSNRNILLKNGDQNFDNFSIASVEIGDLQTGTLNNFKLNSPDALPQKTETPNKLKELKAKKVIVKGYINNLDLATLKKYALKVNGTQKITKIYYFNNVETDNLDTNTLSDKKVLDDFVVTTQGKYHLNQEVRFVEDLVVNDLEALKNLNDIPVKKGKLDILRKVSSERQYIPGVKSFENLKLLNPIQLRYKIRSKLLDTMNPRVTIDTDLDLNEDVRITGGVTVEEIMKSNDVVASEGVGTLHQVLQRGLRLTDTEVPVRLNFLQPVTVDGVFVERINDMDPGSWVVNGEEGIQMVQGMKLFEGDLEITGDTEVLKVNGVDVVELEKNAMSIHGDQIISGMHLVERVVADKGIKSDDAKFGPQKLTRTITDGDQVIDQDTMTFDNLACKTLTVTNLTIKGFGNGVNVTEMFRDVATLGGTPKISGHKTLVSLTVDHMKTKTDFDFVTKLKSLEKHNVKLKGEMYIENQVAVDNIHFSDSCNGVEKDDFTLNKKYGNRSHLVYGSRKFDSIKVFGKVYIGSNIINEVNLTDFEDNTIKIDEPFEFETATFKEVVANSSSVDLEGQIDHLDLDNVFQNNKEGLQSIMDEIVFDETLTVEGDVAFEGFLNGFNVSDLCDSMLDDGNTKSLIIGGDAYFAKGPEVSQINGLDVKSLEEFIWFRDRPTKCNGDVEFKNNVTFKNNITVQEQVNGINLELVRDNYLSKTKNQTVSANLEFSDQVLFLEDISTRFLKLGGEVNGINLERFIQTVFLNDEQLFEDMVRLETCRVKDAQGYYLTNNLDFTSDVMRYDKQNIVSGMKTIRNLVVGNLLVTGDLKIQDVDVVHWISQGILTEGTFKISGNKQFRNVTLSDGLSLEGLLNGRRFGGHAVMLRDAPQNVTGRKTFVANTPNGVTFKALKISGLVDGVDVAELARNQVFKTGNNTLKSEVHFHGNITANNVVIKDLYQGINVTQLLKNITTLNILNNFEENYKNLQEMSTEVENSLRGQAYYLHYYKIISNIPYPAKVFGKVNDEGDCQMMAVNYENGSTILRFFDWNAKLNVFESRAGYAVCVGPVASYVTQINLGAVDYIYVENQVDPLSNEGNSFLGKLIHFTALPNTTQFSHNLIRTNGTIFATSFELEAYHQYCLILINYQEQIHIICIDSDGEFYSLQDITEKSHKASVINIEGVSYLVTIKATTGGEEELTAVWRFRNKTSRFELSQTIYDGDPISLTTVSYGSHHYVAVAYGHLQNTMHLGLVVIRRFDAATREFNLWQNIQLGTPTHLEFAVLPSDELVLYILTENPLEPLIVYVYEGISGFGKRIVASAIPNVISANQFSVNNKHFVAAQHLDYVNVIQAIFKGEKLNGSEHDEIRKDIY